MKLCRLYEQGMAVRNGIGLVVCNAGYCPHGKMKGKIEWEGESSGHICKSQGLIRETSDGENVVQFPSFRRGEIEIKIDSDKPNPRKRSY